MKYDKDGNLILPTIYKVKMELKQYIEHCRFKIEECTNWLLNNFESKERVQVMRDKTYWECELNITREKLNNLNAGRPELGYGTAIEPSSLNKNITNKITE